MSCTCNQTAVCAVSGVSGKCLDACKPSVSACTAALVQGSLIKHGHVCSTSWQLSSTRAHVSQCVSTCCIVQQTRQQMPVYTRGVLYRNGLVCIDCITASLINRPTYLMKWSCMHQQSTAALSWHHAWSILPWACWRREQRIMSDPNDIRQRTLHHMDHRK